MTPETPKQLRRKRWGGVDPQDVAQALADLARRNIEVARELAAAREELDGFKAALRHVSSLLSLAEDRALEIERDAREEVVRLEETKRTTIAELTRLRAQLDEALGAQLRAVG